MFIESKMCLIILCAFKNLNVGKHIVQYYLKNRIT